MTAEKTVTKQTLTLNVENGVTEAGKAKNKAHNYSGIKIDAEPDKILQAALALAGLLSHELQTVLVTEKAELASL